MAAAFMLAAYARPALLGGRKSAVSDRADGR
jgi:hypothetical protein